MNIAYNSSKPYGSLVDLIIKAQKLYKKRLGELGETEAAKTLPWKESKIEDILNNSSSTKIDDTRRIVPEYINVIQEVWRMSSVVGEIVKRVSPYPAEPTIRKYLKLYGLIPEKGAKGGKRTSSKGVMNTSYNTQQLLLFAQSFYKTKGNPKEANIYLKSGWQWIDKKIPSSTTLNSIWRKLGLEKDKKLTLKQLSTIIQSS